ncbi:MAG: hypothetical protein ACOCVZ_04350, partial [Gemmatimonadota bacterium]
MSRSSEAARRRSSSVTRRTSSAYDGASWVRAGVAPVAVAGTAAGPAPVRFSGGGPVSTWVQRVSFDPSGPGRRAANGIGVRAASESSTASTSLV